MKKARKGFTLVELLIVIGIIGILGAMGIIGGQQATDTAKAVSIADNMSKISTAMMTYYAWNSDTIDKNGAKVADVVKGVNAYVDTTLVAASAIQEGQYAVAVTKDDDKTAKWYVVYKLLDAEAADGRKIGAVLANRATRMKLYKLADGKTMTDLGTDGNLTAYDGGDTVFMLVR